MAPVLNLNNEVVRMRKDVKKVRVLTIRRLTRHIAKLKAKKGTEELIVKNQRRAQRVLEEIHAMKELKPDDVTKTALRKEINFEKVCKKPNSTAEDRAIARLATHPLLKKKITAIKEAVKAFKDARRNLSEEEKAAEQDCKQPEPALSGNSKPEKKIKQEKAKLNKKTEEIKPVKEDLEGQECNRLETEPAITVGNVQESPSIVENVPVPAVENTSQVQAEAAKTIPEKKGQPVHEPHSDSSDLDDSDNEEKEYFDDSTEERFYKQSSGFEDSDSESEDDFFIGKVRRTKKKKSDKGGKEKKEQSAKETARISASDLEEQKGSQSSKAVKLTSVFCKSLSETKPKASFMKRETHLPSVRKTRPVVPPTKKTVSNKGPALKQQGKKQALEQPLHPSWEASRKRKEQQAQITAFQGKKIVFDD
ncbi:serum response factor-binding protein 1 [Rhinophrynus dorsalis]